MVNLYVLLLKLSQKEPFKMNEETLIQLTLKLRNLSMKEAIVLDPETGIYHKVYSFDFKSLYPSMMKTSNIGPDTLRYEAEGTDGVPYIVNPGTIERKRKAGKVKPTYFAHEPSVVTLALTDLMTKRKEYKDLKLKMIEEGTNKGIEWDSVVSDEIIVKELSNSIYGIMGYGIWKILFY